MPKIKRRHFLQLSGSALAALGTHQLNIMVQGDRYHRVLAQPTSRKLALLVGVNTYEGSVRPLKGCHNDVELQSELLIHRYGFNPQDIIVLQNEQATRSGILDAFESHLIKQAQPGDVVVFHYSGHGSKITDPDPIPNFASCFDGSEGCNGTLVSHNGRSPKLVGAGEAQDIMGRTLFLLTYALKTENVTVILDSCHSGGGTRGNVVVRAIEGRLSSGLAKPSQAVLTYQDKWRAKLGLSPKQWQELRGKGIAKGVALGSAQESQISVEKAFGEFQAGAFTYQLTRYLWQQPSSQPLGTVFVNLVRSTRDVAGKMGFLQDPIYAVQPNRPFDQSPIFFLSPTRPTAEAVVREVKGNQVKFWLGGVSSQNLVATSLYDLIDDQGQVIGEVEQSEQRDGLLATGTVHKGTASSGTLMRERIRGIPANLSLRVGLDPSLGSSTQGAEQNLQAAQRIELVAVNQKSEVDYLIAKMSSELLQEAKQRGLQDIGEKGSIGVFSPSLVPLPKSFGSKDETVEQAAKRLQPRLKSLLAVKILGAIVNINSATLKVSAGLRGTGQQRGQGNRFGARGSQELASSQVSVTTQKFRVGTELQIDVENQEDQNLYVGIVAISDSGDINVLHPVNFDDPEEAALVEKGQIITAPNRDDYTLPVQGPAGFFELLIIASKTPIRNALRGLQRIAKARGASRGEPIDLRGEETVNVMDDLLGDFDTGTRASTFVQPKRGQRGVDGNKMAVLSTIVEVIE